MSEPTTPAALEKSLGTGTPTAALANTLADGKRAAQAKPRPKPKPGKPRPGGGY